MKAENLVRSISFRFVTGRLHKHIGTISGLEHIPAHGSFVLVPNHRSYFDHFAVESLIDAVRGTPTWFLTKQESFEKPLPRTWARAWYGIPVNRDAPTPATIREVRRVLNSGDVLCVYPEGTRGPGDVLLPFKHGAFRFGLSHDVPLIPLGMTGTNQVLAKGDRWFKSGTIHIAFGPPLEVPTEGTKQHKAEVISGRARGTIEDLITRASRQDADPTTLATQNARYLEQVITGELDENGRLSSPRLRRLIRLANLFLASAPGHPDLRGQLTRLQGLRLLNTPRLVTVVKAGRIRRDAQRILSDAPGHQEASYLLARWHLNIPRWLGGRVSEAIRFFEISSVASAPGDTRALTGLADAYLAAGAQESAVTVLRRVIAETPPDHSRATIRIHKARQKLAALNSAEVNDFDLVRPEVSSPL